MKRSHQSKILQLFAQPYTSEAQGFYFESIEEYQNELTNLQEQLGRNIEEFEIQFIDGDEIDCDLFKALSIHQGSIEAYFEACDNWTEDEKIKVIIAVGECSYGFDLELDTPDQFEVTYYECDTLKELVEQFIDEGLYGEIPSNLRHYLDTDLMARDLGMDYHEITTGSTKYIYRCD